MMDTDFIDEAGHQIPVDFRERSVISRLLIPLSKFREAVRV